MERYYSRNLRVRMRYNGQRILTVRGPETKATLPMFRRSGWISRSSWVPSCLISSRAVS